MPAPKARKNPFFVLLLAASTAFAVTALAYYVSPFAARRAAEHPDGRSPALAAWFDRWGATTLGAELAVMFAAAAAAMSTDHLFAPRKKPPGAP